MNAYVQLMLTGLLPVGLSAALYILEKQKKFYDSVPYAVRQIIYGLLFGGLAVFGTEFGVKVAGVVMNARDAAPICAGLLFGSPAGIISGIIGGVERFLRAPAVGEYTKIACSVATVFAGCFAAFLRKFMFDNQKPSFIYGFATGIVTEILHMLMVFLTNLNDAQNAFTVVRKCTIPMTAANAVSVMLATLIVSIIGKNKLFKRKSERQISQIFQRRLLACVTFAFLLTSLFTSALQGGLTRKQSDTLMQINLDDVRNEILDASDEDLLNITKQVANLINTCVVPLDSSVLLEISERLDIVEINLIGLDGIIYATTESDYLGYDMRSGEQSREFIEKLYDGKDYYYVQDYREMSYDGSMRKYAAMKLYDGSIVQVAFDDVHFNLNIAAKTISASANRHVGENGYIIISNENKKIISSRKGDVGQTLDEIGISLEETVEGTSFETKIHGTDSLCMYSVINGYYIFAVRPAEEVFLPRDISIYLTVFTELLIFAILFVFVYYLVKKIVVVNIRHINDSLAEITGGNLNVEVDVRDSVEFASLSEDINSTVDTLKRYISEAAARIDKELEFARTIQHSALPSEYPESTEFELYASMDPAKEVGGDFYDFYMIGEDKVAFAVADVSGKGIPAAMFMMTSKTMLKNLAESGLKVNDVFTNANEQLCASNEAGMFVTAWMGILDIKTGVLKFANAGHNPPLVKHADGTFDYLTSRAGFVLAGMEGVKYRENEIKLSEGDKIFVYTDGVTEATDASETLFGDTRLKEALNENLSSAPAEICKAIKERVDEFVGEAPQFDDITMLCLEYKPKKEGEDVKSITLDADVSNIDTVTDFVNEILEENLCPMKTQMMIDVAIDEVFSNIAHYAYAPNTGKVTVEAQVTGTPKALKLTFIDEGMEYNPLEAEEPDITLSAEEREIGGLGIFMVKKTMDDVLYERVDSQNRLTVIKAI